MARYRSNKGNEVFRSAARRSFRGVGEEGDILVDEDEDEGAGSIVGKFGLSSISSLIRLTEKSMGIGCTERSS